MLVLACSLPCQLVDVKLTLIHDGLLGGTQVGKWPQQE